jgi:hypothetical protein
VPLEINDDDLRFYDNRGEMLNSTYRMNVFHVTVMLTTAQMMTFLLHFMLRYLQGDLFENSDFCAVGDAIAIIFGVFIYNFLGGLKPTYYLAFLVSSVGCLGILYIENNYQTNPDVLHHTSFLNDYEFYRRTSFLIFMTKFGIGMSYIAC